MIEIIKTILEISVYGLLSLFSMTTITLLTVKYTYWLDKVLGLNL